MATPTQRQLRQDYKDIVKSFTVNEGGKGIGKTQVRSHLSAHSPESLSILSDFKHFF